VILVGRTIFYVVFDYQSKGIGGLIAYAAVVAALIPLFIFGQRRRRARRH